MTETSPAETKDAPPAPSPTFDVLPLGADIRRAIDLLGYKNPTPVQRAVFEPAARGRSLVVQARTGTGKTAAFGLPILDQLVRRSANHVQALVLTPTRELALQVTRELEQLGQFRGTKVTAIYGGAPMGKQIEALEGGAQVVVGTPGRVLDHLRRGTLDAKGVRIFVLDEADEMLSMGFAKELHAIVEMLPKERQGLFFSATLPPDIERMAASQLKDPEFITLSSDQIGALDISHYVYVLRGGDKRQELIRILEVEDPESAVVFCNTKDETQRVAEALQNKGYDADWLNGDLDQKDRERVMSATREGKLRFLVATDVAARGIDISHLTHVINADFPESAEAYVHRTGRTGRAGRTGTAISLIGPKDIGNLYILRLTYKIRPLEKQLPSQGELKTRAEQDLVGFFVDAFAARIPHPDDLALARRMLTHADAERIVSGLLRDHLGARPGDPAAEAAEARRAKNPPPVGETLAAAVAPPPMVISPRAEAVAPPRTREARDDRFGRRDDRGGRRGDARRDDRPRDERPREPQAAREEKPREEKPREEARARDERPRDGKPREDRPRDERPREDKPREEKSRARDERPRDAHRDAPRDARSAAATGDRHMEADRAMNRESARGDRADRVESKSPVPGARVPHSSFTEWEPPSEHDDDKPIFSGDAPRNDGPRNEGNRSDGRAPRGESSRHTGARADAARAPRPPRPSSVREHPDDVIGYTIEDGPAVTAVSAAKPESRGGDTFREDDSPTKDYAELFINVGRREGAKPEDFQKIFEGIPIPSTDVGRIRIRDRMSFVSVKKDAADRAIAGLVGQVIGGRTVVAEIAKERGTARGPGRAY